MKMAALRTLVEQTLAAASKSGTSVAVLENGIRDRMLEQQKSLTGPVVNMGAKIDQMATDFQTLRESDLRPDGTDEQDANAVGRSE